MSEHKKKWQRIYNLLNAKTSSKFLCLPYTKQRKMFYWKSFLGKSGCGKLKENEKKVFLTALATVIKKDPTTSIRKHANELSVKEKTVKTAIKQDFKQNKCNFPSKYWEEWNKLSEEFILSRCIY